MAGKAWTEAEKATLIEMRSAGQSDMAIANRVGRTEASVRQWCNSHRDLLAKASPATPIAAATVEEFRKPGIDADLARMRAEIEQMKRDAAPKRVAVETSAVSPDADISEIWQKCETESAKRIEYVRERCRFRVNLGGDPVGISFSSDQHIAPGTAVDFARMRSDAELIQSTPNLYAVLGGDGVDNHIKHRSAMISARSNPDDQYRLFDYYLSIFAEKIIAVVSGNHDDWSLDFAGIDMMRWLAEKNKVQYAPSEAWIDVTLGSLIYKVAARHQYRMNSSLNQTHAVKQWWRLGEEAFDIGCVCHHHDPEVSNFHGHGKERWACRPGAYQILTHHSRMYGYNSTYPTCPTFILYPNERRIIGFQNVQDGAVHLKALLGK